MKKHVFLIGAKSLGAYGGYETFINKLTEYHADNERIQYHVAVKANGFGSLAPEDMAGATVLSDSELLYHNARCFRVSVPEKLGAAQAIYYDCKALAAVCDYVKKEHITDFVVYIMACRIGPFMRWYYKKIHALGGQVFLNPDGHEWMRAKWSAPIRKYWKYSEKKMVQFCDLAICDSVNIEKYIADTYRKFSPNTTFIAYGAETRKSTGADEAFAEWKQRFGVENREYFLIVGRFVPENNFETMIREFMNSHTKKALVIVSTADDAFLAQLNQKLHFDTDARVKFVGTVYDAELLMKIREEAFAYFHGHEVGGTNPSLLEALGATKLNLLLKVGFNEEVGEDAALYWTKEPGNLAALVDAVDKMSEDEQAAFERRAKTRIQTAYSWELIASRYESVFLGELQ